MDYSLYVIDTETTGLDERANDVIELSIFRLRDGVQKTWFIKPTNIENIEISALRVNGHKLEDLRGDTKEGRDKYLDPNKVIIEVENWLAEDNLPVENRIAVGQNISYDLGMLKQMWVKCGSVDTYPLGRRKLDTFDISFFMDWCVGELAEGYSLSNLTKRFGVKNDKAHSAEADVRATKEVFEKLVGFFKKALNA